MAHAAGGERGRARLCAGRAAASDLPADCACISRIFSGGILFSLRSAWRSRHQAQAVATLQMRRGSLQRYAEP